MRSTTKRLELPRAGLAAGAVGTALVIGLLLVRVSGEATPAPAPPAPVSAPTESAPAPAPTPPPPSAAGLRLHGLLGRGAVIALPDGRQRFFAIGREVGPGLKVERIEPQAVILASAGGELRLGFDGVGPSDSAAQRAAAATPEDALADETLRYRLGLAPRRVGTRTRYVVRARRPICRRSSAPGCARGTSYCRSTAADSTRNGCSSSPGRSPTRREPNSPSSGAAELFGSRWTAAVEILRQYDGNTLKELHKQDNDITCEFFDACNRRITIAS